MRFHRFRRSLLAAALAAASLATQAKDISLLNVSRHSYRVW